jgi:hypothetical protein
MDTRSLDCLGEEIAELSAHLDAATARLLDLIREFDTRGGWNTGFRSCAAWLSWRVGLDLGAARERVRVAHALETLPRLAQALARGELSYAKVRALTRVATADTEERLLAVGRAGTAEHVERIVRGWRRMDRKAETLEDARRHASRELSVYQVDGMVVIRGRLMPEVGAVLVKALDAAREALYQRDSQQAVDASGDVSAETPTMAQLRGEPGGNGARARRPGGGGRRPESHYSPGVTARAPSSRPRVPVPGLHRALRAGPSHSTLGSGRAHHALESGHALSPAPSGGSRGGLSGRATARRRAAVPPAGRRALAGDPRSPAMTADPMATIRKRNEAAGLIVHPRTAMPGWRGERLDSAGQSTCCILSRIRARED